MLSFAIFLLHCSLLVSGSFFWSSKTKKTPPIESIKWGTEFGGTTPLSTNVKYGCMHNNHPTCCALVDEEPPSHEMRNSTKSPSHENSTGRMLLKFNTKASKVKQHDSKVKPHDIVTKPKQGHNGPKQHDICSITKVYLPSPLEELHFAKAEEFHAMTDETSRIKALVSFIQDEIPASMTWLARVKEHMSSEIVPNTTKEDYHYLSQFHITKTCKGAHSGTITSNKTWIEWIEPLTVHARHPFAFSACREFTTYTTEQIDVFGLTHMVSLDYMIIQSGSELHEATSLATHNHTKFAPHRNNKAIHNHVPTSHYLFDAGTSTFESSLVWFLCAYLQRKIAFDQDYGYEYTLLEPVDFWKRVPPRVVPNYHFFNSPVPANTTDPLSPLKIIQNIATIDDFVSFKLDIDTPEVEIPLALELLHNPVVNKLVDEFFFELHFRCEIMMKCGWKNQMPTEYKGLKLDRLHAMRFFQDLRKLGIRAHIWP